MRRRATYEDLLQLPEHLVGEILDGELVTSPRPAAPHTLAASVVGSELMGPFHLGRGGPGGWWILDEPELHLGEDVLVPDLAGWRRSRLPALPNAAFFTLAPDWVCEVVSPSTGRIDRIRKRPIYAREQVSHLWLIEPPDRTVEVYRLEGGRWVVVGTYGGDDHARIDPFAEVELDPAPWWLPEARAR